MSHFASEEVLYFQFKSKVRYKIPFKQRTHVDLTVLTIYTLILRYRVLQNQFFSLSSADDNLCFPALLYQYKTLQITGWYILSKPLILRIYISSLVYL